MPQRGQNFLWPSEFGGNQEITVESVDDGTLTLSDSLFGNGLSGRKDREYGADELRESIDPREVNQNRSRQARTADAAQDAPLTSDPLQWASDPEHYDFPGVDTGPTFRESEGEEFDTGGFLDTIR